MRLSEEQRVSLLMEYQAGTSSSALMKKYKVTREAIRKLLHRRGIPIRMPTIPDASEQANTRKAADQRRLRRLHEYVFACLQGRTCSDCPESDLLVLQFDHRDPAQKKRDVSKCCTVTQLKEEIPKCDIVCANCHLRRTQRMFGSWRLSIS